MQMSEDLEAKIEAQMQETIESAKAVAEADARAASMHDAMMGALREQQAAEARAALLETRIRDEVAVRLRAIGSDRTLWPQVRLNERREGLVALVRCPAHKLPWLSLCGYRGRYSGGGLPEECMERGKPPQRHACVTQG